MPVIFDRPLLRRRRDRQARRLAGEPRATAPLYHEVADRLTDRLRDVHRDFPDALDLGAGAGALSALLRDRGGVSRVVALDISHEWGRCHQARPNDDLVVTGDEELLPFAEASFDLVVSSLALHWVNDLPGTLAQIRRALRPDGFFLASFWGGETLHELRAAWMAAEIEMEGGAGPRVSPLVETADAGALMQRAGFALPVVDADRITVTYEDAFALMADLRLMGEANAMRDMRRHFSRRGTVLRMAEIYRDRFGLSDGRIPASFQAIYLTGWAPHDSQQKPLRPGQARTRLADALGTDEVPTGIPTRPGPGGTGGEG